MSDRAQRAEDARRKILESGDPELIRRLYLLEAAAPPQGQPQGQVQGQMQPDRGGPGLLGMGLAVAGGAWLGTVLGGLTLSPAMQQAFADVAGDLSVDMDGVDMANLDGANPDGDSLSETHDASDTGDWGSGDADGGFGDFFDL